MTDHDGPARQERLFVALDPPDDLRRRLAASGARLAAAYDGRATPADKLHVTLAFLGPVPGERIPAITAALEAACRTHRPVMSAPTTTAGVPRAPRSRIVAAVLTDPDGRLAALADDIGRAMMPLVQGFHPPSPFWPHVTLARLRRPAVISPERTDTEHVFAFDRVTLYASRSASGGGAQYVPLSRIALTGSDRPH